MINPKKECEINKKNLIYNGLFFLIKLPFYLLFDHSVVVVVFS